jgi:multiple sugar transport system substrate-binding protein
MTLIRLTENRRQRCANDIWSLAALVMAIALMSGCGEARETKTVVNFWAMGAEGERALPLIEEFEAAYPEIDVRVQQVPWNAAHEKLLTAFAGNSLPDVCQLGNTWIAEFDALGALADLTDRVAASEQAGKIEPDDFFPGVWQGNVIGDRVCGLPWYVDARLLFVRTDILAKAGHAELPRTWGDWLQAMRDVQAIQPAGSYAMLAPTNEFETPVILGMQAGADMLREDGRYGDFSSKAFRRAFEFYVDIFREGLAPKDSNSMISNVIQEFERGTFAFYVTGPWNVQGFRDRLPPSLEGKWTTCPWPSPDDSWPGVAIAGGSSLVMFENSSDERRRDASWQLLEFLAQPRQQVRFTECTGNLPPGAKAWEASGMRSDPLFAGFYEQLQNVRPVPPAPEWEHIVTGELVKRADAAINGRQTVDEALTELDQRVDEILEKRRWILDRQARLQQ